MLAGLAQGKLKPKHAQLVQALTGHFDDHHGELARMLLDEIDALSAKVDHLTARISELVAQIPAAAPAPGGEDGPGLGVLDRLDEVTGVGRAGAQVIVAEVGLDMAQFPTPRHLVSWAKVSPRAVQSGAHAHTGPTGKGNRYLMAALSAAAMAAARTDTFLGERYRRLAKRRGRQRALAAISRSILVIVWHLLADPQARFFDLGPDYYQQRMNKDRRARDLVRQLQSPGHTVTLNPAA